MNHDQFLDTQYKISFTAGMNQRYHQRLSSYLAWIDRGVRISVGVLSIIALILAYTTESPNSLAGTFTIITAIAGAVAAMILNIIPLGEWQRDHVDLFRRWSDLREEIDVLSLGIGGTANEESIARLRCLESKVHRICGSEPHFRDSILKQCEKEERQSRGENGTSRAA